MRRGDGDNESIEFEGRIYRRYPNARQRAHRVYYQASYVPGRSNLLHREIWRAHFGEIPDGYIIHHADENPLNNDISNLVCLPPNLHGKEHAELQRTTKHCEHLATIRPLAAEWHATEEGRRWHAEHGKTAWTKRVAIEKQCAVCGTTFNAMQPFARFCSALCRERNRAAHKRRYRDKVCPICGKAFFGPPRSETCSRACGARLRWDRASGIQHPR